VADSRILVYSQPFCGYCSAAKRLLQQKGAEFSEVDVMLEAGRRAELIRRTVPQIFIDGRHVGGYDDLSALDRSGELDRLLAAPAP
jgi:glutaredoxin 3